GRRSGAAPRRAARRWPPPVPSAARSSGPDHAPGERLRGEKLRPEPDPVVGQAFTELRADAGRFQVTEDPAVLVDAHPEVEQEQVLEDDDVALHTLHLAHVGDPAGAVPQAG